MASSAPQRRIRSVAIFCMLLMWVVVFASAFMRHHADSIGSLISPQLIVGVRQLHRLAATLVLIGAIALVFLARRTGDRQVFGLSATLLATALMLSVLGVIGGASQAAPVVLVNLLGGYLMLGLCTRLATLHMFAWADRHHRSVARWLLAALLLQAAAGGWSSANSLPGCIAIANCAWPTVAHRVAGLLIGYSMLLFGLMAHGPRRLRGRALALTAISLSIVGLYASAGHAQGAPMLFVLHNAAAALCLMLLVSMAQR